MRFDTVRELVCLLCSLSSALFVSLKVRKCSGIGLV